MRTRDKGFIAYNDEAIELTGEGRKITGWNVFHVLYFVQKLGEEYSQYFGLIVGILIGVIVTLLTNFLIN